MIIARYVSYQHNTHEVYKAGESKAIHKTGEHEKSSLLNVNGKLPSGADNEPFAGLLGQRALQKLREILGHRTK